MRLTLVASCLLAVSACTGFEHKSSTDPSESGVSALVGNWTSGNLIPSPSSCTDFKWNVTEQTGTTASGTFSATCAGGLNITGSADGQLSGSTITWSARGTASVPEIASCPITLSGTAELGVDSIRVPYSGDTCLGKVSGVETLRKS